MDLYLNDLATLPRSTLEARIRRRVQTAYLGDRVVLARILGRQKMFLSTADRGFACHVMLDGYWEMWLTQFLARYIKPGMTVVDVGANFGYYTLLFGDAVGATGHVIAVEPNPDAVSLLRESINLNGLGARTRIVSKALSDQSGHGLLFCPDGEPKNAALVSQANFPGGQTVQVTTTTLDEVTADSQHVDLVKIDAEGGEIGVIAGMRQLIDRDRPTIVLEFNAARYSDPKGFLDTLLASYGSFQEISLDGGIKPMDIPAVIDRNSAEDRLLLFG